MSDSNASVVNSPFTYKGQPVPIPFVKENVPIASAGTWSGMQGKFIYTPELIKKLYNNTDWSNKEVSSLFVDHQVGGKNTQAKDWMGFINNARLEGDTIVGDIEISDPIMAIKLFSGAKFGLSANLRYNANPRTRELTNAIMDNCSIVIGPAMSTNYINNSKETDESVMNMGEKVEEGVMNLSEKVEATESKGMDDEQFNKILELIGTMKKEQKEQTESINKKINEFEEKIKVPEEKTEVKEEKVETKEVEPKNEINIDEIKKSFTEQIESLKKELTKTKEEPVETKEDKTETIEKKEVPKVEETDKVRVEQKLNDTNDPELVHKLMAEELTKMISGKDISVE